MPRYTDQQIADALEAQRGMIYTAARTLGCSPTTIKLRLSRSSKLRDHLDAIRQRSIDAAEHKLLDRIDADDAWAVQFYLRTQGRDRGYGDRVEVSAELNLLQSPDWQQVRRVMVAVLEPYPEAALAVAEALQALEAGA